jgi:hypothetical protein
MSRIDPQFGQDFRHGNPGQSLGPDYSTFAVLDQEDHADDYKSDFDDVEEGRKVARGIINAACMALVFWAIFAAVVLLIWGT